MLLGNTAYTFVHMINLGTVMSENCLTHKSVYYKAGEGQSNPCCSGKYHSSGWPRGVVRRMVICKTEHDKTFLVYHNAFYLGNKRVVLVKT